MNATETANSKEESADSRAGKVLLCGATDWDSVGKKTTLREDCPNLEAAHILSVPNDPKIVAIATSATSCHSVLIDEEGSAYVFGRNSHGQLGLLDTETRVTPVKLGVPAADDKKIVGAATGRNHTIIITESGKIYGMGDNKMGQLGFTPLKETAKATPITSINSKLKDGEKIIKAACGSDFTVVLTASGAVYTFGSPENGQLGIGTDKQYFVSASKLVFDPQPDPHWMSTLQGKKIIDIAAGTSHVLVLDSEHYLYSWGFGGYGRLGHNEQRNSMFPKLIDSLASPALVCRAKAIACGPTCCMAVDGQGMLYLWGKWKNTGDGGVGQSWMTPRYVQDLQGWQLNAISAGGVSLFALPSKEKCTIAWGQSAQNGELGFGVGALKSSTRPQKVEPLEGIKMLDVACGMGHTLLLADAAEPLLDKLPIFEHSGKTEPEDGACGKCHKANNPETILLCDGCDNARHLACAVPKLKKVPEGDWMCEQCAKPPAKKVAKATAKRAASATNGTKAKKSKKSAAS